MNILMLSDVYHPRVNGVSTSIETFRRDLLALGHRVELVAPAYGGEAQGEDGIRRVAGRPVPRDPEDRLMHWGRLQRTLAELADQPWDVVHAHTPFLAHYAGVKFAKRLGVPLVITYHTLFEEYLQYYVPFVPRGATRALARAMSRRQCRQADAVVVPSRAMAERLGGYGVPSEAMRVLPTGLPQDIYAPGDGAAFRRSQGIAPERPVALFVGRAAFEKNIGFLLEAMTVVVRRVPEALLLIAGEGPAIAALKRQVSELCITDRVRFLGYLSRGKALSDCYAAADVFAFASRTETQGLVLLEAMAQGVPVLGLAELGTRDILEGCPGAVIGRDDAQAFGGQLAELLADRGACAALGNHAAAWAHRWQGTLLARQLVDIYGSLAVAAAGAKAESAATAG